MKKKDDDLYKSCTYIEKFHVNFNGLNSKRNDNECRGSMEFCCLSLTPGILLESSGEASVKKIIQKRNEIISEGRKVSKNKKCTNLTCEKCPFYHTIKEIGDGLIHFINLNMYPAPCQSKCVYCGVHKGEYGKWNPEIHKECYDNMFNAIEWASRNNLIAHDALWQAASGEITIHPYKEKIYELMENKKAKFLTNCFIFDEMLAKILSNNSNASINLSIDSGTAETWRKVKGVDNFNDVLKNIMDYSKKCIHPEQITLKYILLPGINDNIEDYKAVICLMKKLKIKKIILSRDNRFRYEKLIIEHSIYNNRTNNTRKQNNTDKAVQIFKSILEKEHMYIDKGEFWPDEEQAFSNVL